MLQKILTNYDFGENFLFYEYDIDFKGHCPFSFPFPEFHFNKRKKGGLSYKKLDKKSILS